MENNSEETLLKSRSSRSCLRQGYRLYLSRFKQVFKASWMPALAYGACFSLLATLAVIFYPRLNISVHVNPQSLWYVVDDYKLIFTLAFLAVVGGGLCELWFYATGMKGAEGMPDKPKRKGLKGWTDRFDWKFTWRMIKGAVCSLLVVCAVSLVMGAAGGFIAEAVNKTGGRQLMPLKLMLIPTTLLGLALSLPVLHVFMAYLHGQHGYWPALSHTYKMGMRHWGMLFATTLLAGIAYMVSFTIVLSPAIVLALANFQANLGLLTDDPIGMPSYIVPLTIVVMLMAGFVNAYLKLAFLFVWDFVHGSIFCQEKEREQFMQNSLPDISENKYNTK